MKTDDSRKKMSRRHRPERINGWRVSLFILLAATTAGAEESPAEKLKVESADLTGEITAASRTGIGVQYQITSEGSREIYLPIDEKTRLDRIFSPTDLRPGDTVQVRYERTYREPQQGKRLFVRTRAATVALVRRSPEGAGALVSTEKGSPP